MCANTSSPNPNHRGNDGAGESDYITHPDDSWVGVFNLE